MHSHAFVMTSPNLQSISVLHCIIQYETQLTDQKKALHDSYSMATEFLYFVFCGQIATTVKGEVIFKPI